MKDMLFLISSKKKISISGAYLFLIIQALSIISLTGCRGQNPEAMPREVSVYNESIMPAVLPLQLHMECDYGKIEFYNWYKKEVKFEITHKVRKSGTDEELGKLLGRFRTDASNEAGMINFLCRYKGREGNYSDTFSIIKVFIPVKTGLIQCNLKKGKLVFLDDLYCDLKIDVGEADVVINNLKGGILYTGNTGNLRISAGKIKNNSSVFTTIGNIRIKSFFESSGIYSFSTGTGIIELAIPSELHAVFESNGSKDPDEDADASAVSTFLLKCGLGDIKISRF